jgi:cytochrome c-type biogenesis protein CcmH/NrfG
MTTPNNCPKCSAPVEPGARFCSSCGTTIEQQAAAPKSTGGSRTCTICGQRNESDATTCVSCGSLLQKKPSAPKPAPAKKEKAAPFSFFQSWKFTAIAALLLVGTLVVVTINNTNTGKKENDPHGSGKLSPGEQGMIDEIQRLEKHLADSPNDGASVLRLANLLQDVRFYDKAIDAYERYLKLDPNNPDALVDLGTTYFAFSFADTTHRHELVGLAQQQIRKAIEVAPKHQLAYFNLGIILFHGGTVDEALGAFRTCVAIDSTTDAAKKAQQFLAQRPITN